MFILFTGNCLQCYS